jgi:succinate dehydrogenase / fumarate reductase membrane anchor subunit
VLLGLWFFVSLASLEGSGLDAVRAWLSSPVSSVLAVLFVAVAAYHANLGLQVVVEDYVASKGTRVAVLVAVKFALVVAALVGVLSVLRIAFGAPA